MKNILTDRKIIITSVVLALIFTLVVSLVWSANNINNFVLDLIKNQLEAYSKCIGQNLNIDVISNITSSNSAWFYVTNNLLSNMRQNISDVNDISLIRIYKVTGSKKILIISNAYLIHNTESKSFVQLNKHEQDIVLNVADTHKSQFEKVYSSIQKRDVYTLYYFYREKDGDEYVLRINSNAKNYESMFEILKTTVNIILLSVLVLSLLILLFLWI